VSAVEGPVNELLAWCGQCSGLTMSFGVKRESEEMDAAQDRFRRWSEQAAAAGGYAPLAVDALKPLFFACELTNEQHMMMLAVKWALEGLHTINTHREP
jgi:hypothetical protein